MKRGNLMIAVILVLPVLIGIGCSLDGPAGSGGGSGGESSSGIALPRTGQTVSYETGDDGDLQMGVSWPNPRFEPKVHVTITDNLLTAFFYRKAYFLRPGGFPGQLPAHTSESSRHGPVHFLIAGTGTASGKT